MLLQSLTLREFRRFPALACSFQPGLNVILGGNGAGKSTLLEGVVWALYGAGAGPGSGVRRSEESLRRLGASDDQPTTAELRFEAAGADYVVTRSLVLEEGMPVVSAELRRADGQLIAAGSDAVSENMAVLLGAGREVMLHACVTGRRELQQLAQLRPVDRLRTLARLLNRSVSRRAPADPALLGAVQALQQEVAEADERIAALRTAPDLLVQFTEELERLRPELEAAETLADRLQDEWSQKRQDVDTRLLANTRRLEELRRQIDKLAEAGEAANCPTCGQPLCDHAGELAARLDDEHYVLTQDAKWLSQRQAQLQRRPPELMDAEAKRGRLRTAVTDRAERVARCEQATQELWTLAGDRKRAAERLDGLLREPAALAAARAGGSLPAPLERSDLDDVARTAAGFLRAAGSRYDALELTDDGRVYGLLAGVPAPVVSGGDEDLMALCMRLATMQLASAAAPALDIMILDEPFGTVDDVRESGIMELLLGMADLRGQLLLATTRHGPAAAAHHQVVLDASAL